MLIATLKFCQLNLKDSSPNAAHLSNSLYLTILLYALCESCSDYVVISMEKGPQDIGFSVVVLRFSTFCILLFSPVVAKPEARLATICTLECN